MLYDVEKATVDARKYCYGKQGNILNPVTQAHMRREMKNYKKPRVTLAEVFRFYTQKKQAIRLFGCAMSWLYVAKGRTFAFCPSLMSPASSTLPSTDWASPPHHFSAQWVLTKEITCI